MGSGRDLNADAFKSVTLSPFSRSRILISYNKLLSFLAPTPGPTRPPKGMACFV